MIESLNQFEAVGDDRYRLSVPDCSTVLEIDRLRRERQQLIGELSVRCDLPGARTIDGVLSVAEMNLSSLRVRRERARYLENREQTNGDVDWLGVIEEFAQRTLTADRRGAPSVDLRSLPQPQRDDFLGVDGLALPRRHPSIIFGDGGTAKSYLALHCIGRLASEGHRVALFDWELAAEDHRARLERLFGSKMPMIHYARCDRPLVSEVDRLRRIAREERLEFAVFDSVAFACDGPPEAAEVASRYFRAMRQLGEIGSLHVAHISKADGADQKPFGSTFWHNGARSTWYAKLAENSPDGRAIQLGLYNRKANLGPLLEAVGFQVSFTDHATRFERVNLALVPDLAVGLSVRQRMTTALRRGAMSANALADEIGAKVETVTRTARRYKQQFVLLDGGFIGNVERGVS